MNTFSYIIRPKRQQDLASVKRSIEKGIKQADKYKKAGDHNLDHKSLLGKLRAREQYREAIRLYEFIEDEIDDV
ncbi:MAG: hypothetical protein Q7S74_06365 [Nanoarchaeota archaeon]|nr:hypothetical protein [Nanoarchaeota archaeon]